MKRNMIVLAVAFALAAVPAQAKPGDYRYKIFGGAAYVSPMSDSSVPGVGSIEASAEVGWEIGGELKANRFGFELAYVDVTHDVEAGGVKAGEIRMKPLFFTVSFHIINGKRVNWHLGPTLAHVDWGNLEYEFGLSDEVNAETTFGVSTGVDVGITKKFAIFGGLRWIDLTAERTQGDGEVVVDPLFARLGAAFRF